MPHSRPNDRAVPLVVPPANHAGERLQRAFRCAVGVASVLLASTGCAPTSNAQPLTDPSADRSIQRIAVVGDLQRTSAWEFWREQNDPERERIVQHLAQGRPSLVLMLGDLVFDGASDGQWEAFDELVKPLREASIPCATVLGNHEYWGGGAANLPHVTARFPHLAGSPHTTIAFGGVALVLVDSNRDELAPQAWDAQRTWFAQELVRLDSHSATRMIIVATHHPPFTNSSVTADEPSVRDELVPIVMSSRKASVMLSGHVHSYEHFERGGKHFIVSGGGGGPRAALHSGADRRHPDDLFAGPAIRPFHVLWLEPATAGLAVEVTGLSKGAPEFAPIDRFVVPWP